MVQPRNRVYDGNRSLIAGGSRVPSILETSLGQKAVRRVCLFPKVRCPLRESGENVIYTYTPSALALMGEMVPRMAMGRRQVAATDDEI